MSAFPTEKTSECLPTCDKENSSFDPQYFRQDKLAVSIYLDNDLFLKNYEDDDYTAGIAVAFSGSFAETHLSFINSGLSFINDTFGASHLFEKSDLALHTYEVGMALFTPENLEVKKPIINDRPYASLLYISNPQQHLFEHDRKSWMTTLSIGVIGLPAVSSLQNSIHRAVHTDIAEGWDNQISNGGELSFKYSLVRQQYHRVDSEHLQFTTAVGMSVGYITEAFYGTSFRVGLLRRPWWNFNVYTSNYGEKSNVTIATAQFFDEVYFVTGANIKLRAYNSFLQGQFRDSKVTYTASEVEPIVYEGWFGVGSELSSGWRISYIVRMQSSEVKVGQSNDNFNYGELTASYSF